MNPVKTINYNSKTIEIHPDIDPQDPRDEDNADIMICFHNRYKLGDKHDYQTSDFSGWDEMKAQLIKDYSPVAIKPLYLYDHSGITISTSHDYPYNDRWDAGQLGFCLISRKTALKEHNCKRITKKIKEWAELYLDASVEEYDQYLRGDIYGYVIKDEEGSEIESCWGFYGLDDVIEEAKELTA